MITIAVWSIVDVLARSDYPTTYNRATTDRLRFVSKPLDSATAIGVSCPVKILNRWFRGFDGSRAVPFSRQSQRERLRPHLRCRTSRHGVCRSSQCGPIGARAPNRRTRLAGWRGDKTDIGWLRDRSLAAAVPALVRSLISERSNSASAPIIWNSNRPLAVVVSIPSCRLWK